VAFRNLIIFSVILTTPIAAQGADADWHETPFRIQAGKGYLNTAPADSGGHAAPFLADIDGDGRRDLVVGSITGKFRLFLNVGTDTAPKFSAEVDWLMAGDEPAEVPGFCCIAAGPQLVDIDNDGILDLSSGSYFPGAIYWYQGKGNGKYSERHMLTDAVGRPIFTHSETIYTEFKDAESLASNIAWIDWRSDNRLSLVIGSGLGELFVREQSGNTLSACNPPIKSQPVFDPAQFQREITIDGDHVLGKLIPTEGLKNTPREDAHAAPTVADWDGDGLEDILLGSSSGSVYLLRNSGKAGAPEFKTREKILDEGTAIQWIEGAPLRGRRSQIQAVDYNRDGKMDLLLGDWFMGATPLADLDAKERKQMQALRKQLAAVDSQAGYKYQDFRDSLYPPYPRALLSKASALEQQLQAYLQRHRIEGATETTTYLAHGTVWVFIRK
jgi:hypothetical protein